MLALLCLFTLNTANFELENSDTELDFVDIGYKNGRALALKLYRIPGQDLHGNDLYLTDSAREAWLDMISDAARDGIYLKANFAFRSKDQQKTLKKKKGRFASRPGWSDHQMGVSVDISGTEGITKNRVKYKTEVYHWLAQNSYRYGFKHTVRQEPWHLTYVENINNS